MKYGKMLLAALLAVVMMVSLCACTGGGTSDPDNKPDNTTTTTTTTTTKADDGKVTYTVTVKDEQGAPIVGAMVQICKDTCIPAITDANGVATWTVAEDEYKVSFAIQPEGYAVEENYYFDGDATEMTIVLKAAG